MISDYNIVTNTRGFYCPITGAYVRTGEVCLEDKEGNRFDCSMLPKRKLIPLKTYLNGPEIAVKSN